MSVDIQVDVGQLQAYAKALDTEFAACEQVLAGARVDVAVSTMAGSVSAWLGC